MIISSNTTWTTGSTISLTSNIQIAHGATLTIQSGVSVQGNGFTIETFGNLDAAGSAGQTIQFQSTNFIFGGNIAQAGSISIDYANMTGGSFLAPTGNASYGAWSITNSTLTGLPAIYAWYPTGSVLIENDYFENDGGISVGTDGATTVSISHNTFEHWNGNIYSDAAIENWASYGSSSTAVDDNNFLDVGKVALELPPGYTNAGMSASGNYFGTTDATIISNMIYDQNVDLNSAGIINNTNIATSLIPICFCVGTLIHTTCGYVEVEKLRIGDMVSTLHNGPRPVRWIGRGKVLAARGKRTAATPVIVCKGAIADNVPTQDLHITKAHSLYLDGVFIPVEFLLNHKSILWNDRAQEVEIYHVELDSHDVLLANGTPVESYRDDGNRWLFQNANAGLGLSPKEPYAPVITGGAVVDAIWRRLLDRAGPRRLPPLTDDPDLHLVVDGMRVNGVKQDGQTWLFVLAGRPVAAHVASRDAVPAELGLSRDSRPLGVALRRLVVRQDTTFVIVEADDGRLTEGFHSYERTDNLRWTNGYATLPAEVLSHFSGRIEIVLHLGGSNRYVLYSNAATSVAA
jgi:hypothetical protein